MGSEGFSSALGWVSIACWIVVYSPQIVENYQLKSGEGLSVLFVLIWLLGDLCNLIGACMAGLQATVIILAIYYTLCDITLLYQIYYYRYFYEAQRRDEASQNANNDINGANTTNINEESTREETPLLNGQTQERKERKTTARRLLNALSSSGFIRYLLALTFVFSTGIVAWLVSRIIQGNSNGSGNDNEDGRPKDVIEWKSQVIGWTSAVLYLGSRIPQILKNFQTRCEGLSLALFMFSIAGNVTYALSICAESMEKKHLIANASWLAGSTLTIFLDLFVLFQFFYFRSQARAMERKVRLGLGISSESESES
ncbi:PQ-loop-domain-containing [Pyrrhoderma noxium]|uniref:PQ-loop-domain-containing n=1 Tax=Pyrrhoderma noxium TaxID=2282107 RepID=A0A286UC44_9AGAM|nr:PQ-loop-domain-containing [Pyrrhoderma noxium]